jgi:preprotein translocase subunit SecE
MVKEMATQQTQAPTPKKDSRTTTTAASAQQKPGRLDRLREYIRNVMAELRKVTWPTREETRNLTIVVIGLTGTIGTALYIFDVILSWLYRLPR